MGMFLAACSHGWDQTLPSAPANGIGITKDGAVAEGAGGNPSSGVRPFEPPYGSVGVASAYEAGGGYRLGAGDKIFITVMGQPDLTGDRLVDGSGAIVMPLAGLVPVAGLTSAQASAAIAGALGKKFLRDPQVAVQVTTPRPFFIVGEVTQSGSYPYQSGMTVQNAVAIAGGYSIRANQEKVTLTRKSAQGTNSFSVPVTTQIYPGDIIYVGERWF